MSQFPTPLYPGVNPDDDYGPQLNAVCIVFICLSFVAVVLRFVSRAVTNITLGLDDWLIIIAAILSWVYTAGVINEVLYNYYGQHIGRSDATHLEAWFKGLFAIAILYPIALTASKLSLLALLHRIFGVSKAGIPMWIAAGLNIAWMIAAVLVGIFSCNPVEGFWNLEIESTCIQEYDFFLSNECITITLDLVVLLMPIYFISHIRRSLSQRISISSTFALGLIATVVSAIRLWQLIVAQQRPGFDPTFNETGAALWAVIELNVWVIVACIPSLRPLFTRTYIRLGSGMRSYFTLSTGSSRLKPWTTSQTKNASDSSDARRMPLPIQQHSTLTPDETLYSTQVAGQHDHDGSRSFLNPEMRTEHSANSIELSDVSGIRVERNFTVTRPEQL